MRAIVGTGDSTTVVSLPLPLTPAHRLGGNSTNRELRLTYLAFATADTVGLEERTVYVKLYGPNIASSANRWSGSNRGGWQHPQFDQLYDQLTTTLDRSVRTQAIVQAAKHGVSIENSTLYCKMEPCLDCAKMIVNAGIKRVVCEKKYHAAQFTREFFKTAGLELVVLYDEVESYPNQ